MIGILFESYWNIEYIYLGYFIYWFVIVRSGFL